MASNFRQIEILERARREGKVVVDDLARHFHVTVQTIRRDLTELSEVGKLERVHGGAIIPSGVTNIFYEERRRLNETGKQAIAEAVAHEISNGSSVFLNIGTTTEAVAKALRGHSEMLIVTNNLNIAQILSGTPDCEIVLTGGTLRHADGGLTGTIAIETVRRYKFDHAVIGGSALDCDGELLDFDPQEIAVSQAALARARQSIAAIDSSKLDRKAPISICGLDALDMLVTDERLPRSVQERAEQVATQVLVAQPPPQAMQA